MKATEIEIGTPVAIGRLLRSARIDLPADITSRRLAGATGVVASWIPVGKSRDDLWFVRHDTGVTAPYLASELIRVLSWLEVRAGLKAKVARLLQCKDAGADWHADAGNRCLGAEGTIVCWITNRLVLLEHDSGVRAPYLHEELTPIAQPSRHSSPQGKKK